MRGGPKLLKIASSNTYVWPLTSCWNRDKTTKRNRLFTFFMRNIEGFNPAEIRYNIPYLYYDDLGVIIPLPHPLLELPVVHLHKNITDKTSEGRGSGAYAARPRTDFRRNSWNRYLKKNNLGQWICKSWINILIRDDVWVVVEVLDAWGGSGCLVVYPTMYRTTTLSINR